MSGIFKAGQLVRPVAWNDETVDLFNVPGGARPTANGEKARVIGRLEQKAVALVIAVERADGGSVYVIGPTGGGWAFGAFLTIVVDV